MAHTVTFGDDLRYRTIAPDEIALIAYYAIKCGMSNDLVEAAKVRAAVRSILPVCAVPQIAILLNALDEPWGLQPEWAAFKDELLALTD